MPNFELAVDAVKAVAESSLGRAVAEDVVAAAQSLVRANGATERTVETLSEGSELSLSETWGNAFTVDSRNSKSMQDLLATYTSGIPETMKPSEILGPDADRISSILFPERTKQLALSLYNSSKGWSSAETVLFHPRVDNREIMPVVRLTNRNPSRGALGSYVDLEAKLGEGALSTVLSAKNTGVAVHEITHHEQGFLQVCRQADQLGWGCKKLTPDEINTITDKLGPGVRFRGTSLQRFMDFRKGRQLTAEASDRAEQLQQSKSDLFSRPILGSSIRLRLHRIDTLQSDLENPAKSQESRALIRSLYDPTEGSKLVRQFIASDKDASTLDNLVIDNQRQRILAHMPKVQLSKWTDADYARAQENLSGTLDQSHLQTLRLQRSWSNAYNGSLHEREAKFNEFIGVETVKKYLGQTSKHPLPVYGNLELY